MGLRLLLVAVVALALGMPTPGEAPGPGDVPATLDLCVDESERDASDAPLVVSVALPAPLRPTLRQRPRVPRAARAIYPSDVFRPPRPRFERI